MNALPKANSRFSQTSGVPEMDWPQYKILADTPGVWSRWMLEQTLELLQHPQLAGAADAKLNAGRSEVHQRLVVQLQRCMTQTPVPKPTGFKGGSSLDMFSLSLTPTEARAVLALVQQATDLEVITSGTTKRGLGGFVAAWQEYLGSIDQQS